MARSKLDKVIEKYQLKLKEKRPSEYTPKKWQEYLLWVSGVIYGLKYAKNL